MRQVNKQHTYEGDFGFGVLHQFGTTWSVKCQKFVFKITPPYCAVYITVCNSRLSVPVFTQFQVILNSQGLTGVKTVLHITNGFITPSPPLMNFLKTLKISAQVTHDN